MWMSGIWDPEHDFVQLIHYTNLNKQQFYLEKQPAKSWVNECDIKWFIIQRST